MAELLHLQALFGDLRRLGLNCFVQLSQFLVEASQLCPLVFKLGLRDVVGILQQSV
jgi:hypothetical protein